MRALVSNLTAILLVVHAMIGCCHHHWHSDGEGCSPRTTLASTCDCCEHHADPGDADHEQGAPCNGELECQGVCSYLPTPKTQLDDTGLDCGFEFAAVIPCPGSVDSLQIVNVAHRFSSRDNPPPLSLNVLHQRLLI